MPGLKPGFLVPKFAALVSRAHLRDSKVHVMQQAVWTSMLAFFKAAYKSF